jgi:hypothetical protein
MQNSAVDLLALTVGAVIAAIIATTLLWADRGHAMRRVWLVGVGLATAISVLGAIDLLRASPRETPLLTVVFGSMIPVLGAIGVTRASRRVRPLLRGILVFVAAFILLFGGLLLGAALVSRLSA